jgi:tetratricopeptide (TPR) repeat protein
MKLPAWSVLLSCVLAALLFAPAGARSQDKPKEESKDPQQVFVGALIKQANNDVAQFYSAKGKQDPAKHPGRKWAEIFWQYSAAHPGTPLARRAASLAMFWWTQSDDSDTAFARAQTLAPDDPIWEAVVPMLGHYRSKDRDRFIQLVEKLVEQTQREDTKAVALYHLASAYRRKDPEKAKALLRAAIEAAKAAPSARWWEESEGFLYELTNLNVGQTFPHFSAPTTDNKTFSLEDLRGKTVLLNFWATW